MNYKAKMADRTGNMQVSAIREILKLAARPELISMAGGLPAPETFPLDIISTLLKKSFDKHKTAVLQYCPTEGFFPLRESVKKYLSEKGMKPAIENITITSGSQGILDGLGKVLINKDDFIAVEAPTYLGALQAFNAYCPKYVSIKTDDNGPLPESLEHILKTKKIKLVYLVPTFQNPSGITTTLSRRKQIAELVVKYKVLLLEDDPYSELRYSGSRVLPIQTFAPENVIYAGTFSKVFAPGIRVGFCFAPKKISEMMVMAKQGIDLHTSTLSQALADEFIRSGLLKKQIKKNCSIYKPKLNAMLSALKQYFPKNWSWSKPEGGLFVWVKGPVNANTEKIYFQALKKNIAFVPGKFFFTDKDQGLNTIRLNFSCLSIEKIQKGIKILAELLES